MTSYGQLPRFLNCNTEQIKNKYIMKTKLMTLLIVALGFATINAGAQVADASRVKILSTQPGILRLIHAIPVDESINVKFIDDEGVILSDEITGFFPKGVSKKYDVRKLGRKEFRMEITTSNLIVTYRIVTSKDRKTITPYLEKTVQNYVMASRN